VRPRPLPLVRSQKSSLTLSRCVRPSAAPSMMRVTLALNQGLTHLHFKARRQHFLWATRANFSTSREYCLRQYFDFTSVLFAGQIGRFR